jgi:hypothetical protein
LLSFAAEALAMRARRRRDQRPLLVGTVDAGAPLIGKYMMDASLLLYAGLALLVGIPSGTVVKVGHRLMIKPLASNHRRSTAFQTTAFQTITGLASGGIGRL